LTAACAGDQARHLPATFNINMPLPDAPYNFNPIINTGSVLASIYGAYYGYGPINNLNTIVNSNWTALELSARHSAGKNLFLSFAYTWSHGLSDQTVTNYYNPKEFYGSTPLNVSQVFTASAIYSLPWLQHYFPASPARGRYRGGGLDRQAAGESDRHYGDVRGERQFEERRAGEARALPKDARLRADMRLFVDAF
jgi:hypothetical protein